MLILSGPPGVGKTTVAGILAARSERAVHLEADRFFYFIRNGLIDPWLPGSDEQNRLVLGAAAEAAARYAAAGYESILEGIVIPRWTLATVREALEGAGLEADYAVLRAPQSVYLGRFQEREGGAELLAADVLAGIGAEFDDLGELEHCAIDVSGMTPEQMADAIEERRTAGALRLAHG